MRHMTLTGQADACCSIKANFIVASPQRCRQLFFKMSRFIRARSNSRRSRSISEAWSAGEAIVGAGGFAAVLAAGRLLSPDLRCQRRSIVGMIPNSPATSVWDRPFVSHSATASRLNSSVNRRFALLAIIHLQAAQSPSSVSAKPGEDQDEDRGLGLNPTPEALRPYREPRHGKLRDHQH